MPANIREIKGRMKAVGNIERITKTMQLIASARFQAMQKKATQSQAYTQKIGEMVGELAAALGSGGEISHPLISPPDTPTGKELVLVLTSERGLCGAYNGNVMRTALRYLRDDQGLDNARLEVVGKKGQAFCKFNGLDVAEKYSFGDSPAYEDVEELAQTYMECIHRWRIRRGKSRLHEIRVHEPADPGGADAAPAGTAGRGGKRRRRRAVQFGLRVFTGCRGDVG